MASKIALLIHAFECNGLVIILSRWWSWHEYESAVTFRQDLVIQEDVTIIHSAQYMLPGPIHGISHEELAIGRPTYDFNLQ